MEKPVDFAEYTWMSQAPDPPGRWDLRHLGWRMQHETLVETVRRGLPVLVDWRAGLRSPEWRDLPHKQSAIAVGVEEPEMRARLIGEGFGDALDARVALVELAARLLKLEGLDRRIPRQQRIGPVLLDLFHRDAKVQGRWVGLHPREFALLWRLAETPQRPVGKRELLRDVWRLSHEPETNSLEVHVSRLRAKLALSDAGWIVQTHEFGGYFAAPKPPDDALWVDRLKPMTQESATDQPRNLQTDECRETRND